MVKCHRTVSRKTGEVSMKPCHAVQRSCPLGGSEIHREFADMESADVWNHCEKDCEHGYSMESLKTKAENGEKVTQSDYEQLMGEAVSFGNKGFTIVSPNGPDDASDADRNAYMDFIASNGTMNQLAVIADRTHGDLGGIKNTSEAWNRSLSAPESSDKYRFQMDVLDRIHDDNAMIRGIASNDMSPEDKKLGSIQESMLRQASHSKNPYVKIRADGIIANTKSMRDGEAMYTADAKRWMDDKYAGVNVGNTCPSCGTPLAGRYGSIQECPACGNNNIMRPDSQESNHTDRFERTVLDNDRKYEGKEINRTCPNCGAQMSGTYGTAVECSYCNSKVLIAPPENTENTETVAGNMASRKCPGCGYTLTGSKGSVMECPACHGQRVLPGASIGNGDVNAIRPEKMFKEKKYDVPKSIGNTELRRCANEHSGYTGYDKDGNFHISDRVLTAYKRNAIKGEPDYNRTILGLYVKDDIDLQNENERKAKEKARFDAEEAKMPKTIGKPFTDMPMRAKPKFVDGIDVSDLDVVDDSVINAHKARLKMKKSRMGRFLLKHAVGIDPDKLEEHHTYNELSKKQQETRFVPQQGSF